MQQVRQAEEVSGGKLWFVLLAGSIAWTLHLLLAYVLGEFGCLSALARVSFLDINGVAWSVLGMTVPLAGVSAVATWMAWRMDRRLGGQASEDGSSTEDPRVYMARAGWITDGLFLFVILFETVPVFYFLQRC